MLIRQADCAVLSHGEGRIPSHLPHMPLGVCKVTMASKEDVLRLPLRHVVCQREAGEPAPFRTDVRIFGEGLPRPEGQHGPAGPEECNLPLDACTGQGPPQAILVESHGALEIPYT